jgi:hypothetical protein
MTTPSAFLAAILTAILLSGSLWLGLRSNLLRDTSTAHRRPFSFSRVQLLWWLLIISFCLLHRYGLTYELADLNETCLVLLGIGAGTTAIAKVIDTRQRQTADISGTEVIQDRESAGFFTDVLSDENGVSVHRLQAFVFNVIYGVAFFTHFVATEMFQTYGAVQYAVLGMSSAGYLGLKALENNPRNQVGAQSRGTAGDELIDADPAATTPAAVG